MHRRSAPGIGNGDNRVFLRIHDLDQRSAIFGSVTIVGHDQDHRLPHIGDATVGERRDLHLRCDEEETQHLDLEAGQIFLSEDGVHAGELTRMLNVDREYFPTSNAAAGKGDMQHAGECDVVDELAAAREQA